MKSENKTGKNFIIGILTGTFLIGFSLVLWTVLGKNMVISYHDQLDGEVLCYLYRAKYLGKSQKIREFLGGMPKTSMTPPAVFIVLLYRIFSPFTAFTVCQYMVMAVGFLGLYLFLCKAGVHPFISCMCGTLFAYLPLLPVYGLSLSGVPLTAWIFWNLSEKNSGIKKKAVLFLLLIFMAGNSSLVLSGFAILMAVFFTGIFCKTARKNKNYWTGFTVFAVSYLVMNRNLAAQVLGIGESFVSHREEFVLQGSPLFSTFKNLLFHGVEHANSYPEWILLFAVLILISGSLKKEWRNEYWKKIGILLGFAVGIAFFCAVYDSNLAVEVRKQIGGAFVWFQLDRICWLYPAIWYTVLAFEMQWIVKLSVSGYLKTLFSVFAFGVFFLTSLQAFNDSTWKINIKNILSDGSEGISWKDFYAEDLMDDIETCIRGQTGKEPEDYRVASLGICPAAALYHGFYCLDGYSNNYDLEYKHKFQKIIEPELEKNEYLSDYFKNWGNRCYLFSSETPGYFTVEKGGFYYADYEMDSAAFKELGGEYLLSAAYIENAEDTGLYLMREDPFVTDDSYYQIYLYGVK